MVICHSYIKLPEGICCLCCFDPDPQLRQGGLVALDQKGSKMNGGGWQRQRLGPATIANQ